MAEFWWHINLLHMSMSTKAITYTLKKIGANIILQTIC